MRGLPRLTPGLAAGALLFVLPQAGFADEALVTITPGGGVTWPDSKLGIEQAAPQGGGILGVRIVPLLAIEARGTYMRSKTTVAGYHLDIAHGEGNLTLFPFPDTRLRPYLTGGAGLIRHRAKNEFAVNGGVGLALSFNEALGFRVDARDVAYRRDMGTDKQWLHSYEVFGGISIGFGRKPEDTDLDGVPDQLDQCPGTPRGALVDANGCPTDTDGDGVYDGIDLCSATPRGALVDASGCPRDSDGDGIFDGLDECASTPRGAMVDVDGCPRDSDGDGIFDGLDVCAATPRGALVDANGCPTDTDGDGVFDGIDECPGTPSGTEVDSRGCPLSAMEAELRESGVIRFQNVTFVTGSADLQPESYPVLDQVGEVLSHYPRLRLEIGGHTDSQGSEAVNQRLSEERAQSVLEYLLDKFPQLLRSNFSVVGYGESRPIASNDTEEGRARNRRVEFRVLNPRVLK